MTRHLVVLPAIIVLAVAADIAVRLADDPVPEVPPPPAVAGPGPSSAPTVSGPLPGWSPSLVAPPPSGWWPAVPPRAADPTRPDSAGPDSAGPDSAGPDSVGPDSVGPGAPGPAAASKGPGPQAASLDELLKRHDPLPAGIPEQLNFYSGGGSDCQYLGLAEPLSVAVAEGNTIPGVPVLCVLPFRGSFQVDLTTPTGRVLSVIRPEPPEVFDPIAVPLEPGSPPGRYRVRVSQGKDIATAEFVAQPARTPTMWVHPAKGFPGATVHTYLAGFPPGRTRLYLYACLETDAGTEIPHYRTTHEVTVGADGVAHLAIETHAFTSPTCYLIVSPLVFAPRPDGADPPPAYAGFLLR